MLEDELLKLNGFTDTTLKGTFAYFQWWETIQILLEFIKGCSASEEDRELMRTQLTESAVHIRETLAELDKNTRGIGILYKNVKELTFCNGQLADENQLLKGLLCKSDKYFREIMKRRYKELHRIYNDQLKLPKPQSSSKVRNINTVTMSVVSGHIDEFQDVKTVEMFKQTSEELTKRNDELQAKNEKLDIENKELYRSLKNLHLEIKAHHTRNLKNSKDLPFIKVDSDTAKEYEQNHTCFPKNKYRSLRQPPVMSIQCEREIKELKEKNENLELEILSLRQELINRSRVLTRSQILNTSPLISGDDNFSRATKVPCTVPRTSYSSKSDNKQLNQAEDFIEIAENNNLHPENIADELRSSAMEDKDLFFDKEGKGNENDDIFESNESPFSTKTPLDSSEHDAPDERGSQPSPKREVKMKDNAITEIAPRDTVHWDDMNKDLVLPKLVPATKNDAVYHMDKGYFLNIDMGRCQIRGHRLKTLPQKESSRNQVSLYCCLFNYSFRVLILYIAFTLANYRNKRYLMI